MTTPWTAVPFTGAQARQWLEDERWIADAHEIVGQWLTPEEIRHYLDVGNRQRQVEELAR